MGDKKRYERLRGLAAGCRCNDAVAVMAGQSFTSLGTHSMGLLSLVLAMIVVRSWTV